jgi:hypothetical protein
MKKTPYWLTFEDGRQASVWEETEAAAASRAADAGYGSPTKIERTCYPARPRIDTECDNFGPDGFPSFCIAPRKCAAAGGSCVNPHGRSCTA